MILQTCTLNRKIISIGKVFLLIYFLCTPFHELAFYCLNYALCLLLSYLNHAFVYYNQICATIYLMYPLQVKEFVHKLTTEYTLHSSVKLSITQNIDFFLKIVELQSKLMY